jgi:hypothetical protein
MQNVSDRTPSSLLYRIIDTIQTTSIAAAAWTYFIRHYGDQETAVKISTYVYCPNSLFLSLKYVLRQARTLYVSQAMHTIPIKYLDLPMIDCCLLHRAFRGLSGFKPPADMRSTQALTAACVNMSASLFPDAELY